MKRVFILVSFSSIVALLLLTFGCAARTVITSEPPGVHISVNDQYLGDTPLRATILDEPGGGSVYLIKAEKSGYKTTQKVFREEGFEDASTCIPNAIYFQLEREEPAPTGTAPKK